MGGHPATFAVSDDQICLTIVNLLMIEFDNLRVQSGSGILHFLNETGHVFQEEIVEMFLLHVLQLEDGFFATSDHDASVCERDCRTDMSRKGSSSQLSVTQAIAAGQLYNTIRGTDGGRRGNKRKVTFLT